METFLTAAWRCFSGDGNYIHMMEENLEALKRKMQILEQKRDDLLITVSIEEDKGLQPLAQVQGWFSRVEGVESQVKILLEDESTETSRLCLLGYISEDCISSYFYGKKVLEKLKEFEKLISDGDFVVVAQKKLPPKVVKKHIQITVGLDSMVKKAWTSLINAERRILGFYGMGGVGKTTLLGRINNKFLEEKNEFDVVIWVVVSKDLQNDSIQDQILERLRLDKEWEQETKEKKGSHINNILSRKKFVLFVG